MNDLNYYAAPLQWRLFLRDRHLVVPEALRCHQPLTCRCRPRAPRGTSTSS